MVGEEGFLRRGPCLARCGVQRSHWGKGTVNRECKCKRQRGTRKGGPSWTNGLDIFWGEKPAEFLLQSSTLFPGGMGFFGWLIASADRYGGGKRGGKDAI